YFAFPLLYASAFSGFYLPLMIVLWLIILRGLSVELRSHIQMDVWKSFFDGLFFFSSALLAIFFGAALANVVRGVPLGADGYFFLPLWTNWQPGPSPGILDWYTVIGGVLALLALAIHGACYLLVKTEGDLQQRARNFIRKVWIVLLLVDVLGLVATIYVQPDTLTNYHAHPVAYLIPVLVVISLLGIFVFSGKKQDRKAFLSSCLFLASMMAGAAYALYPTLLPAVGSAGPGITVSEALSGPHTLHVGLIWWGFGMLLAVLYFVVVYKMFRGKVTLDSDYGH
ncbi:MAG: cytochrome d ubiquinol oxidase subunit II, partial [Acidobacteriaceae bacterium]